MHSLAARFLAPANPVHRQYEALRAHYVDGLSVAEAAAKFHYAPGSFRNLLARFKRSPDRAFFLTNPPGPKLSSSRPDGRRRDARIVELRQKLRLSVAEIEDRLQAEGLPASSKTVLNVLRAHGFGKLSRRSPQQLEQAVRPSDAPATDSSGSLSLIPTSKLATSGDSARLRPRSQRGLGYSASSPSAR